MLKRDLYYERISTKSLRDDVRYLGNILGKVIKDQEGKKFFDDAKEDDQLRLNIGKTYDFPGGGKLDLRGFYDQDGDGNNWDLITYDIDNDNTCINSDEDDLILPNK